MHLTLKLSDNTPLAYPTDPVIEIPIDASSEPLALLNYLDTLEQAPTIIAGRTDSPLLLWLTVIARFPSAQRLLFDSQHNHWLNLTAATARPDTPPQPHAQQTTPQPETATEPAEPQPTVVDQPAPIEPPPAPAPAPAPPQKPKLSYQDVFNLARKFSAWGLDKPEPKRSFERLRQQVEQLATDEPSLVLALSEGHAAGVIQAQMLDELLATFHAKGEHAARQKLERIRHSRQNRDQYYFLNKALEKEIQYLSSRTQRSAVTHSKVTPVTLIDGRHPNSIRSLAPAATWRVYVDETGDTFGEDAAQLPLKSPKLGRLVALVVAAGNGLAEPKEEFHGTEESVETCDALVNTLLRHRVGIFGFTVKDPALHESQWIAHVHNLLRWTILQLPLLNTGPIAVECCIEQRSDYTSNSASAALVLEELLESELKGLFPARFAQLRVTITFVDKRTKMNGYVDAIAFTWGSPNPASRDRLKKTAWLDHCLVRPSMEAMQRLYLALDPAHRLRPHDWYELCVASRHEPSGGLISEYLTTLGQRCTTQGELWLSYLDEVRRRQQMKAFHLNDMVVALGWLAQWQGQQQLPPAQSLMLHSARLAIANHRGQDNHELSERCLALVALLRDEAPAEACNALLRIAISATNSFHFDRCSTVIDEWLSLPIAVPGRLNHAKLLSTRGQQLAFQGNFENACNHFHRAIDQLQQLTDPRVRERELRQTRTYLLMAMLDGGDPLDTLAPQFNQLAGAPAGSASLADISQTLASSGHEQRYLHHLLLRMLLGGKPTQPKAIASYLQQRDLWQRGTDHPWPLISAYRAVLLCDHKQQKAAAAELQHAIDSCEQPDSGPLLLWMGAVLRHTGQRLGLATIHGPTNEQLSEINASLPAAPVAVLTEYPAGSAPGLADLLQMLARALPFNFH